MKQKIRSFIIAPPGKLLVSCDLSQAETWVVAYLAREEAMKWALINSDIHYETAAVIFDIDSNIIDTRSKEQLINDFSLVLTKQQRFTAKKTNHALSYRMSPSRFVQVYNAEDEFNQPITIYESRDYNEKWHHKYNRVKPWWLELDYHLLSDRTLVTPYGRKRTFYGQLDDELKKQATAFLPQSTVADHFNGFTQYNGSNVEGGLRIVYNKLCKPNPEIKLINQSHDSCILEVPRSDGLDIAREVMSILDRPLIINGEECRIPVDGEIGEIWGQLEKI